MRPGPALDGTRYGLKRNRLLLTAVFLASTLFCIFTSNDSPNGIDRPQPIWVAAGAVGGAVSVFLLVRAWRIGAYPTGQVLVIRNLLRTRRIPVSSIAGFERGKSLRLGLPRAAVQLRDGTTVGIRALEPPRGRPDHPPVLSALEELERWRQVRT